MRLITKEDMAYIARSLVLDACKNRKELLESANNAKDVVSFIKKEATYEQLLNLAFNSKRKTKYLPSEVIEAVVNIKIAKELQLMFQPIVKEKKKIINRPKKTSFSTDEKYDLLEALLNERNPRDWLSDFSNKAADAGNDMFDTVRDVGSRAKGAYDVAADPGAEVDKFLNLNKDVRDQSTINQIKRAGGKITSTDDSNIIYKGDKVERPKGLPGIDAAPVPGATKAGNDEWEWDIDTADLATRKLSGNLDKSYGHRSDQLDALKDEEKYLDQSNRINSPAGYVDHVKSSISQTYNNMTKAIPKWTSQVRGYSQKNPEVTNVAAWVAGGLAAGAAAAWVYKRFFSAAAKKCTGTAGDEKTKCMISANLNANKGAMLAAGKAAKMAKTPSQRDEYTAVMQKYKKKIMKANQQLKAMSK